MKTDKLILGTAQFGLNYGINNKYGKPNIEDIFTTLDYAYSSGIKILDSAESYGDSHERIGRYHNFSKNFFKVISKFSPDRDDLPKDFNERIQKNINDLQIEKLYAYMFHSFNDLKKYCKKFINEIDTYYENKIEKIGVSIYTNDELEEAMNYDFIKLIQLPLTYLIMRIEEKNYY